MKMIKVDKILLKIFKYYTSPLNTAKHHKFIDFGGAKLAAPSGCARRAVELVAEEGFGLRR